MRNQSDIDTITTNSTMDVDQHVTLETRVTPRFDVVGLKSDMKSTQVCATLQANELPEDDSDDGRAAVDIVVALDVSGSMTGKKLQLCKETLKLLLRQLSDNDRFGLVTFASEAQVDYSITRMTEKAKNKALSTIMALGTRGCTNLSGAIGLAAEEIRSVAEPNDVRTVFLLTDGHANEGITSEQGITQLARGCFSDQQPPITMHCFGYGSDHNEALLLAISNATQGGTYYFVENDSGVVTAFGDALGGVLSVVSQNTTLRITVPKEASEFGVSIIEVHHEKAIRLDDGSYKVPLGDLYAEEGRDVLMTVMLAKKAIDVPHVNVSVTYTDTVNKMLATSENKYAFIARPGNDTVAKPDKHVEVQWLRVNAVQEMEAAKKLSRDGDLEKARSTINASLGFLKSNADVQDDGVVMQMVADMESVEEGLRSQRSFLRFGAKNMTAKCQTHARQRCAEASPATTNVYRSKKKKAMTLKMFANNSAP
uniref:VWFA domain-containing protein n=1 Tax=Cyclophora tenuis TaxID=216820 RepID=A0A7S1DBC7_CYCTE|mmetsp:Transcript_5276/g.9141  ORF Transcript_5276/g.9141 Transcript_5276/m.9141 type:complete len:482 (+) Transcript_5276:46-1491(+)